MNILKILLGILFAGNLSATTLISNQFKKRCIEFTQQQVIVVPKTVEVYNIGVAYGVIMLTTNDKLICSYKLNGESVDCEINSLVTDNVCLESYPINHQPVHTLNVKVVLK